MLLPPFPEPKPDKGFCLCSSRHAFRSDLVCLHCFFRCPTFPGSRLLLIGELRPFSVKGNGHTVQIGPDYDSLINTFKKITLVSLVFAWGKGASVKVLLPLDAPTSCGDHPLARHKRQGVTLLCIGSDSANLRDQLLRTLNSDLYVHRRMPPLIPSTRSATSTGTGATRQRFPANVIGPASSGTISICS